jgi:ferric-dicitrate binding protein FerR (iron transport regulator)
MEQERLWILLGRKLARIATKEELQELELLLLAYGEDAAAMEIIERMWASKAGRAATDQDSNILDRIEAATHPVQRARHLRTWAFSGVAVCVVALICWGFFRTGSEKKETMNVIFTRRKSHSNLQFPDGTTVVLNENSRISYNADFGKLRREIMLEGEAYFDVAKNPGMPLIIHVKNVDIKVLGTSFNVKAYPTDKSVETSLIRGAVEVSSNRWPGQRILLRPNEKVEIPVSGGLVKNTAGAQDEADSNTVSALSDESQTGVTVDPPEKGLPPEDKNNLPDTLSYNRQPLSAERTSKLIPEIAWMYRKLVFNQEPFASVAEKMERWYGVKFYFEDDDLKNEVFTGSFSKETLEEGLKALQFSYPFDFVIKKNEVFIKRKK